MTIGDPRTEEGREFLKSRSPYYHAPKTKSPLLIAQGANDQRVVTAESDQIVEILQENGGKVVYLLFPDEGHGLRRPSNVLAYFAVTEIFFAQCLGGRSKQIDDELDESSIQVPVGLEHIQGLEHRLKTKRPVPPIKRLPENR